MRQLAMLLALVACISLSSCGGARIGGSSPVATPAPTSAPTTTMSVVPQAGNWQFSMTSAVPGRDSLGVSGNININPMSSSNGSPASAVSGVLHVDGSSCFDRLVPLGVTGTVNLNGGTSLTLAATNGQVVTLAGTFSDAYNFKGTYKIDGGCAGGDQGVATALNVPAVATDLKGTFTDSNQKIFGMTSDVVQSIGASSEGSFSIQGSIAFDSSCFAKGTLTSGAFPSGSFMLGTLVSLDIDTGNALLTFVGTLDPNTGQVSGSYSVAGGSCDGSGSAVLQSKNVWDY